VTNDDADDDDGGGGGGGGGDDQAPEGSRRTTPSSSATAAAGRRRRPRLGDSEVRHRTPLSLYRYIYSLSIEDRLLTQISLTRLLFIVGPFRAGLLRDSLFFSCRGAGPRYLPSYLLAMDAQNVMMSAGPTANGHLRSQPVRDAFSRHRFLDRIKK
jgi:hypothetical protein